MSTELRRAILAAMTYMVEDASTGVMPGKNASNEGTAPEEQDGDPELTHPIQKIKPDPLDSNDDNIAGTE